ncbi:protein YqbG [Aureibacillus halotolerans]|uniref:Uncharacterized protein DUF3199 n=1 Tax=Aureibacillus halotolerans TaxID=1508390 RepID=A0A4R6TS31_9BACI|nr:DUF3199 family protein [Aureibacillus halotolerans]TDQ35277.1 uncharacterized protein DUF3199 [Aureibacillus halotolerans]
MLITVEELKDYTSFDVVKQRSNDALANDILEAHVEIVSMAGHDFTGEDYNPLPPTVVLAAKKLSQFHALVNSDAALTKGYQSENIGKYSYTLGKDGLQKPDVSQMIAPYVVENETPPPASKPKFKMRSL